MKLYLLLLSLLFLLMPTDMKAGIPTEDDAIVLSDLTYQSSSKLYYFDVSLQGSRIYCAYNMDIYFPEGIDVAKNNNGTLRVQRLTTASTLIYPATITYEENDEGEEVEVKTYSHNVSSNMPGDHWLRVGCASFQNEEFISTSGKLFRVFVTIDESLWSTSFCPKPILKVSGIALTTKAEEEYNPADFTCRPFSNGIPADRTLPVNISANNQFGTLILPFASDIPEGVKAFSCNGVEDDFLTLSPVESMEPCTPYILYADNGFSSSVSGTVDMTADYPPTDDNYVGGLLTGVLTKVVVNTGYFMQNQGDGPKFYNAEGSAFSLPAGRCYLISDDAGAKAFGFKNDDEPTGITTVEPAKQASSDVIYNLNGMRVKYPQKGQIYIQNHQKFIK